MSLFRPSAVVKIVNATQGNTVCERCAVADSMWVRGKGLLGRKDLPADEGILLVPGTAIHMFGMKFAIDVIFLTRDDVVTDLVEAIAPGRAYVARAHHGKPYAALELPVGVVARTATQRGDRISRETREPPAPTGSLRT